MQINGQMLKLMRTSSGLTLEQFASMVHCTTAYVSMVESGKRRLSKSTLRHWLSVYGLELSDFEEAS
jgi:transcriptional regulator with XRE-family HTH domain